MLSRILPALVLLGLVSYPDLFDHLHAWISPEAQRPQAGLTAAAAENGMLIDPDGAHLPETQRPQAGLTAVVGQNGMAIDPDGAQIPTEAPRPGDQR